MQEHDKLDNLEYLVCLSKVTTMFACCCLQEWDIMSNVTKLSRAGFRLQCLDTEDVWIDNLQREIDLKILPPLGKIKGKGQDAAGKLPKLEGTYDAVKARLEKESSK